MESQVPSTALQRGAACVYCRMRKRRCDGVRPICGPCSDDNRPDDCEYRDPHGSSRTRRLEDNIRRLEARIRDLENPVHSDSPSIGLHLPYTQTGIRRDWWKEQEPPVVMRERLIDIFLMVASSFGFFLNHDRFRTSAMLHLPMGHASRPTSALLTCTYFLGAYLVSSDDRQAALASLLPRTLTLTSQSLSSSHPDRTLHTLQVHILLANWFFCEGRIVEGNYQRHAAIALGIGSGIYDTNSALENESFEFIHARWACVVIDKCWSVALSSESTTDVPILNDFADLEPNSKALHLYAQTSVLWYNANQLATSIQKGFAQQYETFGTVFDSLDEMVDNLSLQIQAVPNTGSNASTLLAAHSLTLSARISLHTDSSPRQNVSKASGAARRILDLLVAFEGRVDPILGTIWLRAIQFLISRCPDEDRLRATKNAVRRIQGIEYQLRNIEEAMLQFYDRT